MLILPVCLSFVRSFVRMETLIPDPGGHGRCFQRIWAPMQHEGQASMSKEIGEMTGEPEDGRGEQILTSGYNY